MSVGDRAVVSAPVVHHIISTLEGAAFLVDGRRAEWRYYGTGYFKTMGKQSGYPDSQKYFGKIEYKHIGYAADGCCQFYLLTDDSPFCPLFSLRRNVKRSRRIAPQHGTNMKHICILYKGIFADYNKIIFETRCFISFILC